MRAVIKTAGDFGHLINLLTRGLSKYPEGLDISVCKFEPPKSGAQNAKLHVLIARLADASGNERDMLKQMFKDEFGPVVVVRLKNKEVATAKGLRDYTKAEASDMIEHVLMVAAEQGYVIE